MASNRKQPFGYKVEKGVVINHPIEHSEVRYIYAGYELGATFQMLADEMQKRGIPYDGNKPWNKNMIARILADPRYMGLDGYPQLITERQFYAVAERREKRNTPSQKTPMQKYLKRQYGIDVTSDVELGIKTLMERLRENPQQIAVPITQLDTSAEVKALQDQMDALLKAMPVDEAQAKQTAMRLAEAQYESIGNAEYETLRIRHIFQRNTDGTELLRRTVAEVTAENGVIQIRLRNQQTMSISL